MLELNNTILPFNEFYGRNIEQMPKLVEEGRIPLSVANLMQQRLENLSSSEALKTSWWNNYFDTGDGIFYHPNGDFKVVLGAQPIRDMNSDSKLSSGALVLNEDKEESIEIYKSLDGVEFKRNDLDNLFGKILSKSAVKSHPVWNALVPDKALFNEYVDAVFSEGKNQFGYDNMMGVWISSPQDKAVGRLWCVYDLNYGSIANGDSGIHGDFGGRLVGVAPEALVTARGSKVPNPKNIADNVHNYLNNTTMAQGVTKKGLLKAVLDCYKKKVK